jgi:hypothetical protein
MFWDSHGHGYCYVLQRPNIPPLVLALAELEKTFKKEQARHLYYAFRVDDSPKQFSLIEFHMTHSK